MSAKKLPDELKEKVEELIGMEVVGLVGCDGTGFHLLDCDGVLAAALTLLARIYDARNTPPKIRATILSFISAVQGEVAAARDTEAS